MNGKYDEWNYNNINKRGLEKTKSLMMSHDNNQVNCVLEIGSQMNIYCMFLEKMY